MSGLEVVSVVLVAIPLVRAALTKYGEAASIFRNSHKVFADVNLKLDIERAVLMNSLDKLLEDTDLDDHVKLELIRHVNKELWSDKAVEAALKMRLTNSFDVYLETVRSMHRDLLEFRELLMLGPRFEVTVEDCGSLKEMYKRFSFLRKESTYRKLAEQLHEGNVTLKRLAEHMPTSNWNLSSRSKRVARLSRMPSFEMLRETATAVFHTLQQRLNVSCKSSHRVSVSLKETGEVSFKQSGVAPSGECIFRLVIHHDSCASTQAQPGWQLEEAEIRSSNVTIGNSVTSTIPPPPVPKKSKGGKSKKSVKWHQLPLSPSQPISITPASQNVTGDEIEDLCASITKLRTTKYDACLGYLVDSSRQQHSVYRPKQLLLDQETSSELPLQQLLTARNNEEGRGLTTIDRRRLALSLSHGILRLHGTPWLKEQWNSGDIVLFEQDSKMVVDYPFASASLSTTATTTGTDMKQASNPIVKNHVIFALAIVLIELCMNRSLQELQTPEDLSPNGSKHASTDHFTAIRLLSRVEDEAGIKYAEAVKRCINLSCDLDYANPTLQNEAFRRAVYEGVVAVLEDDVAFSWSRNNDHEVSNTLNAASRRG